MQNNTEIDLDLLNVVRTTYDAIDGKFGKDIKVLRTSEISLLSDYFIIATASNPSQMRAICEEVEKTLHKNGVRLIHSEGLRSNRWVLLDFGTIVVHIFGEEDREYYNLERIWGDAAVINFYDDRD